MPDRAKRPCHKIGCKELTDSRFCIQHDNDDHVRLVKRQFDRNRRNDPYRKVYDTAAWRRVRQAVLQRDPICVIADLCVKYYGTALPSTEVDHIIAFRAGGAAYDLSNLQGLCKYCHSKKSAKECGFIK